MLHEILFLCQYPAWATGWWGGWLVGGKKQKNRFFGFLLWVLSDISLILYGLSDMGIGVMIMQAGYVYTSWRGMKNNPLLKPTSWIYNIAKGM